MRKSIVHAATLAIVMASPAFAAWQSEVNAYDKGRLAHLAESRAEGLRQADRGASRRDLDAIHGVLDRPGRPISGRELVGSWQCRQMKLGGIAPSIVYTWFTCRVRATRGGLYFEKLTGTEKISGYLETYENGRLVLLGAISVKKERPRAYSGANPGAGADTTSSDAIGIISATGRNSARIEFPYPTIESDFDIMELKR